MSDKIIHYRDIMALANSELANGKSIFTVMFDKDRIVAGALEHAAAALKKRGLSVNPIGPIHRQMGLACAKPQPAQKKRATKSTPEVRHEIGEACRCYLGADTYVAFRTQRVSPITILERACMACFLSGASGPMADRLKAAMKAMLDTGRLDIDWQD